MFDDLLLPSSIGSVHDLERSRTMTSELRRGDQERASGGEAAGAGSARAGTPWCNESSKARIRDSVPRAGVAKKSGTARSAGGKKMAKKIRYRPRPRA